MRIARRFNAGNDSISYKSRKGRLSPFEDFGRPFGTCTNQLLPALKRQMSLRDSLRTLS